jgi:hypothetical protein
VIYARGGVREGKSIHLPESFAAVPFDVRKVYDLPESAPIFWAAPIAGA